MSFFLLSVTGLLSLTLQAAALNAPQVANPPDDDMILIPSGSFAMGIDTTDLSAIMILGRDIPHINRDNALWWFGAEIPRHQVSVEAFYMDRHEVTNRQFRQFVEATGYKAGGDWERYAGENRADHPVVNVTWHDAAAYARWAGKRLPTEEEWEYAARGGRSSGWFPWGDHIDASLANYRAQGESFWAGIIRLLGLRSVNTKPVGSYAPNGYGLYDMVGNVAEWCANERRPYPGYERYFKSEKPFSPFTEAEQGSYGKAVRGGGWQSSNPAFVSITHRSAQQADSYKKDIGFRCVRSLKQSND